MDTIENIEMKFKIDNFANNLAIVLDDLTKDTVKMQMELKTELNKFYGRPHGGAIYSLAVATMLSTLYRTGKPIIENNT